MNKMENKCKFTGIVVVYNEKKYLRSSLQSLQFCDEIIVVDLGSTDGSVDIAVEEGAEVVNHEWVPVPGRARKYGAKNAKNDWIIFLDPDEVFPSKIAPSLCRTIRENNNVGRIYVPWLNYFKGDPLMGTVWGGKKYKGHILNKKRCKINKDVHNEISIKSNYNCEKIEWNEGGFIKHYWMDSWGSWLQKHFRYVKNEGEARFKEGERFPGWIRCVWRVIHAFKSCFVDHEGWREGGRGLFLSAFWALYQGASLLSLRHYQVHKRHER